MRTITRFEMAELRDDGAIRNSHFWAEKHDGVTYWRATTVDGVELQAPVERCGPCDKPITDATHDAVTEPGGLVAGRRA